MSTLIERTTFAAITALVVAVLLSCASTSRYRLDLYLMLDGDRRRTDVESRQYVMDAVVGNPYANDKVEAGSGNVAIVTLGARGTPAEGHRWQALGFDEYFRCQVYVQVEPMPEPDSSSLVHRSLLHVLGRYEQPIEHRVFLPREGYFIIDSVTLRSIYFTINGAYANQEGEELLIDGRFNVDHGR